MPNFALTKTSKSTFPSQLDCLRALNIFLRPISFLSEPELTLASRRRLDAAENARGLSGQTARLGHYAKN
ncbi:hypothetical protein CYMTET_22879 [Cymbomonas tetramitiformis]|uniref:Uncharacterized protein n=1 Tax=Cymbomonas tetramitiformis TaxID=36881 RepID=A0AAE0FZC7_9CHLO|nr:hypothetical protein CYMTET_22879 [Cymbomonas tetramitiformis]